MYRFFGENQLCKRDSRSTVTTVTYLVIQIGKSLWQTSASNCMTYKVKVGVLHPGQQPGSSWDSSLALPLVGIETTEVIASQTC